MKCLFGILIATALLNVTYGCFGGAVTVDRGYTHAEAIAFERSSARVHEVTRAEEVQLSGDAGSTKELVLLSGRMESDELVEEVPHSGERAEESSSDDAKEAKARMEYYDDDTGMAKSKEDGKISDGVSDGTLSSLFKQAAEEAALPQGYGDTGGAIGGDGGDTDEHISKKQLDSSQFPPAPKEFEEVTAILLRRMDVYELGKVKVTTYKKLPPRAILQQEHLRTRMPASVFENSATLTRVEMASGIAELLNSMSTEEIRALGPNWMDIVHALPAGTWARLETRVVENIPWRGVVANTDPRVWRTTSFVLLNRAPQRFWQRVPLKVWMQVPPSTWARVKPKHINQMRTGYVRRLKWVEIQRSMRSAKLFNGLRPEHQEVLPWKQLLSKLKPRVFGGLSPQILKAVPPAAWRKVTIRQMRTLGREQVTAIPEASLKEIPTFVYKGMYRDQIKVIGVERVKLITKGEVEINESGDASGSREFRWFDKS